MKNIFAGTILSLITLTLTALASAAQPVEYPVHLLPDADGFEVQQFMRMHPELFERATPLARDIIDEALEVGNRNLEWLKFINANKSADQKISLTDAEHTNAYPITEPNRYSPKIIQGRYNEIRDSIPESMRKIIFEGQPFTAEPTIDLEPYRDWARKVDRLYQSASRWRSLSFYKFFYVANRSKDIRGYYFLSQEKDIKNILDGWATVPAEKLEQTKEWLWTMCWNAMGFSNSCVRELDDAIKSASVYAYYSRYLAKAKKQFDSNFIIYNARTDAEWPANSPNLLTVPFRDPKSQEIRDYLSINIEDEWRWNDWQLKLSYRDNAATHIVFEPDVVPHVNGLGGSEITMNSSAPLTEYDVKWTIRHEYGHTLGFPDCYVEYYDSAKEEFVNYQIDTSNLMCSRRGKLKETHFEKMKATYFSGNN